MLKKWTILIKQTPKCSFVCEEWMPLYRIKIKISCPKSVSLRNPRVTVVCIYVANPTISNCTLHPVHQRSNQLSQLKLQGSVINCSDMVCPYRHMKWFNWMRILTTSNSKRATLDKCLVCRSIKVTEWRYSVFLNKQGGWRGAVILIFSSLFVEELGSEWCNWNWVVISHFIWQIYSQACTCNYVHIDHIL